MRAVGKSCCQSKCHFEQDNCVPFTDSCSCVAIQDSIGNYFLSSANTLDIQAANNTFEGQELVARTLLAQQYIIGQNDKIRAAFDRLVKCTTTKCGKDGKCIAATANAIANTGIGFIVLVSQAALAKGNLLVTPPNIPNLEAVIAAIGESFDATIALIFNNIKC